MSDLIDRQAAIDAVHNYWEKRIDTLPTRMTEDGEAYDIKSLDKILEHNKKLVGLIKAIPSEPGKVIAEVKVDMDEIMERVKDEIFPPIPQWIPVTERLPETGGTYIVSGRMKYKHEMEYDYFVDAAVYSPVDGWDTFHDNWEGQQDFAITAWMPLPEPYKEAD